MQENIEIVGEGFAQIKKEVESLRERIAGFEARLEQLEANGGERSKPVIDTDDDRVPPTPAVKPLADDDRQWRRVGQEVWLPRVAALSFMLVVALILRTVTDNGMVPREVGIGLGGFYAVSLIVWGCRLYQGGGRLAPVFPACGTLLLFSIIYEANIHFASLSLMGTYLILLASEMLIVTIGVRCRAVVLLYLAVFFSTAVGISLDFPDPMFEMLALVLLVNVVAAQIAAERQISGKLRWLTLFLVSLFWTLWGYKLHFALSNDPASAPGIGLLWSLPLLGTFYLFYIFSSLRATLKRGGGVGPFHYVMPIVNAGGAFVVAYFIVDPWLGLGGLTAQGSALLSAVYIAVAAYFLRKGRGGREYVLGATILLIEALPLVVPVIWALPIWVGAAAVLTVLSSRWQSGAVRVISYLFQLFVVFFAYRLVNYETMDVPWLQGMVLAAFMGGCCLWLYRWCRLNPPRYESVFFKFVDSADLSANILLFIGLLHLYSTLRFGAVALVDTFFQETPYAFACSKSIIINLGAVVLMLIGRRNCNRELLMAAVPLVLIGAIKVFLFDLFRGQGMPLIISVFSFGVVAVVSSLTLKAVSATEKDEKGAPEEAAPELSS